MKKFILLIAGFLLVMLCVTTAQAQLKLSVSSQTHVSCNGNSSAEASLIVSGGYTPYTYLWMPGGQTTDTATGLAAGSYTATATDSIGDTASILVVISYPPPLAASTQVTNVSCFGLLNGNATANPIGGTPPFQFLWSPGGQTSQTATGLGAGSYTITITDGFGCQTQAPAPVTQPLPLQLSAVSYNSIIQAYTSGGTLPYTYSWNPPVSTTSLATGLLPGTYTITVTDSNVCTNTILVTVPTTTFTFALSTPTTSCGSPAGYVNIGVMVSCNPSTMWFNNCEVDIGYTGGEFAGDNISNGGVIVSEGNNFQPAMGNDYNIFTPTTIGDSLLIIKIGDSSSFSPNGTIINAVPDTLFNIRFRIQNSCLSDSVSLIPIAQFAYYTDTVPHRAFTCDSCNPYICGYYPCNPYICGYDTCDDDQPSPGPTACAVYCYDSCAIYCFYDTCCHDTVVYADTNIQYNGIVYSPTGFIITPACPPTITYSTPKINAGTNAKSVSPDPAKIPPNSSILTILGSGFGSTKDSVQVTNADGPGIFSLDSMDILYWSENQILVKMPNFLLRDTNTSPAIPLLTPGSGPFTVYNACGNSASGNLQINYNIENRYISAVREKMRPNIVMNSNTASVTFRCDTSITNDSNIFACVRYAVREWNCWTGVNWKIGKDTTGDTSKQDGVSYIYFNNHNFGSTSTLMKTVPWMLDACIDSVDSVGFSDESDIAIKRDRYLPGGYVWSYDTTTNVLPTGVLPFYDAILHEFGHAIGLDHVSDSTSLMYWQTPDGGMPRVGILSGITYPGPATLLGGLDMVYTSVFPGNSPGLLSCSQYTILDTNGNYCHDPTLSVPDIPKNSFGLNLFPNPINNGNLIITYTLSNNSVIQFKIIDCTGRAIMKLNNEHKPAGNYSEQINVDALAGGVYLFIATINEECKTIKFIKL